MPQWANLPPTTKALPWRNPGQSIRHVPALDGIRGVAILLVFACHYGDLSKSNLRALVILNHIKECGWFGVDIFFALSGFLITGILIATRNDAGKVKNFYARRALRLFPVYYGVWAFLAAYALFAHLPWRAVYWAYIFFLGNFASYLFNHVGPFLVEHFWSLSVEEQFYLILPPVIWKLRRTKSVAYFLIGCFVASIALKLMLAPFAFHIFLFRMLPAHMEGLACGGLTALAWRYWDRDRAARIARIALPACCLALLAAALHFHGLAETNPIALSISLPLVGIGSAALIVRALTPNTWVGRAMDNPLLRFYGRYSYGFYVYHLLLRVVFKNTIYDPVCTLIHKQSLAGVAYVAICLILLTALSVVSYHWLEAPFLRMKRWFSPSNAVGQEQQPTAAVGHLNHRIHAQI